MKKAILAALTAAALVASPFAMSATDATAGGSAAANEGVGVAGSVAVAGLAAAIVTVAAVAASDSSSSTVNTTTTTATR